MLLNIKKKVNNTFKANNKILDNNKLLDNNPFNNKNYIKKYSLPNNISLLKASLLPLAFIILITLIIFTISY
jgi:hypothetical protein